MVQVTILGNAIVGVESAHQGWICYVPHITLSFALYCPLGLVEGDTPTLGKHVGVNSELLMQGSEMGCLHCGHHVNFDVVVQDCSEILIVCDINSRLRGKDNCADSHVWTVRVCG